MKLFVGGVVFGVAAILAVTLFGWVPVVLVGTASAAATAAASAAATAKPREKGERSR